MTSWRRAAPPRELCPLHCPTRGTGSAFSDMFTFTPSYSTLVCRLGATGQERHTASHLSKILSIFSSTVVSFHRIGLMVRYFVIFVAFMEIHLVHKGWLLLHGETFILRTYLIISFPADFIIAFQFLLVCMWECLSMCHMQIIGTLSSSDLKTERQQPSPHRPPGSKYFHEPDCPLSTAALRRLLCVTPSMAPTSNWAPPLRCPLCTLQSPPSPGSHALCAAVRASSRPPHPPASLWSSSSPAPRGLCPAQPCVQPCFLGALLPCRPAPLCRLPAFLFKGSDPLFQLHYKPF